MSVISRDDILAKLRSAKPMLENKYNIKTLALFGSYSRNDASSDSDVDLLVDFEKNIGIRFVDLADEIEEFVHLRVDLVSRNGIKPKYYQAILPQLIYV